MPSTSSPAPLPHPLIERLEDRTFFSGTVYAAPQHPAAASTTMSYALGGNLMYQSENTADHAFVDLVKASTGFRNLSGGKASVDVNGWPTQDFTVPLWGGSPVATGRYNMSFHGPSGVKVTAFPVPAAGKPAPKITRISYSSSSTVATYRIDIPSGLTSFGLKFTNTGGHLKYLRVLQPGYALSNQQVFTNRYVNFLKSLSPQTLRFMDMTATNNSLVADWSQRAQTTDATWSRAGIPWGTAVDLVNQLHTNIWINVPAHATDDYVYRLAKVMRDFVDPSATIYVEYSNETWAQATDQGQYNIDAAQAEVQAGNTNLNYDGSTDPYDLGNRRAIRRLMQISNIFKQAWLDAGKPSPINDRVRVVVSGQANHLHTEDDSLMYLKDNYGSPSQYFWSVGAALYFGMNKYNDSLSNGQWTTANDHLTKDQVLEGMELSIKTYEDKQKFAEQLQHAAVYGLQFDTYEIGNDTRGPFNLQAKKDASTDPRFKDLMERFIKDFFDQGGSQANYYALGSRTYDTQYGTWSITYDLNLLNLPKEQGFRELRGKAPTV